MNEVTCYCNYIHLVYFAESFMVKINSTILSITFYPTFVEYKFIFTFISSRFAKTCDDVCDYISL